MQEELDSLRERVDYLSHVRDLIRSPGWKVILNHFNEVVQAVSDQLDVEEDFDQVKRLQERKRAFKSMLETPEALCNEHSQAVERLQEMEQLKQENDQYGIES